MGNNKKKKKVVLRLDLSRTERAFKEEESLWDSEIERMVKLLDSHAEALKTNKKNFDIEEQPLLSIGIFGSPGSGKTSLLKTFARWLNNRESGNLPVNLQNNIYSLPVIKPNLLAKYDHFLYKFLATALEADRKKREGEEKQFSSSSILSPVQHKFQEVSEYLQVIDNLELSQEDDPLGVSMERLERHESDLLLNKKLRGFITELADTLVARNDISLVLMPVDDADLSLDILVSALDTYWRYLQHPRLIPVFTFTGRLAEELLRVHFESKLAVKGHRFDPEKLVVASTPLLLTENMAIQYLGRLFPVRNRIRLGRASARVLEAKYKPSSKKNNSSDEKNQNERSVLDLLRMVSELLFGHSELPLVPAIRAPLRMVTLRRQLQIVDAMHSSGIEAFIENKESGEEKITWGQAFDLAAWTLLNTHRDILKEINMNLDDLYTWTPQGLRRVVLNGILNLKPEIRRRLLKHWLYRSESRRSQMLSLLAANVFRPRMHGEELTGDDSDIIALVAGSSEKKSDKRSFSIDKGILWFLELCIGFYLPQTLAAYTSGDSAKAGDTGKSGSDGQKNTPPDSLTDVGWGLMSGPVNAIHGAVKNDKTFSTGMLFLNPKELSKKLEKGNTKANLLLHIWCFYGYEADRPWGAVSLWRGLGLLGRLLRLGIDYRETDQDGTEFIQELLKKHLQAALVVRHLPKGKKDEEEWSKDVFKVWKTGKNGEAIVGKLIKELQTWLKKFNDCMFPMVSNAKGGDKEKWKKCFVRRLHGESIMSIFFQDLGKVYFEESLNSWTGKEILKRWCTVLDNYWMGCVGKIRDLIMSCPLLKPFLNPDESFWSVDEIESLDIPVEGMEKPSI